jgi:ABC-type transport system involved in cytochrome c biogenesis permease subunit
MSTPMALKEGLLDSGRERAASARPRDSVVVELLRPLASLKFTVVLFALAIFLVFASTLAQKELDIWEVIHGWYRVDARSLFPEHAPWFNPGELFVHIPFQIFFPDTFFSSWWKVPGGFYFPRGWVLGLLMAINLVAAHSIRFQVQSRGTRLWAGVGIIGLGCLATWAAIESGASREGILEGAMLSWSTMWKLLLLGLATFAFGGVATAFMLAPQRRLERALAALAAVAAGGVLAYALYYGQAAEISPESMRILWQLLKGTGAGLVLLVGCQMVFKKRAGIVLLHGGVGLLFLYEVIVGTSHEEAQMPIFQGTRSNWVHDVRSFELAVTERGAKDEDRVTVVPQAFIKEGELVALPDASFDVRIVKFHKNSKLRERQKSETTPATQGIGLDFAVEELKPVSGTDAGKNSDMTSAYIELVDKKSQKPIGTYLVGLEFWHFDFMTGMFKPQEIDVDGKKYLVELRYKRTYKPYTIEAVEVRKDDYVASDKPRNYSSLLHVVDKSRNIDRQEPIKMNSPMRFAGETFYQSGYNMVDGHPMTTIAVVRNDGWMLPYVSCMIVAVGMLVQFGLTLGRFLNRRRSSVELQQAAASASAAGVKPKRTGKAAFAEPKELPPPVVENSRLARWLPWAGVALVVVFMGYTWRVPKAKEGEMDFYAFGKLPVAYESRVKPFDSMARSTLAVLSHRQKYKVNLSDETERSKPAVQWLLDLMTSNPKADDYRVFRIDNLDALKALGLERNEHSRYSLNDLLDHAEQLGKQIEQARTKKTALEPYEREIVKLNSRIQTYRLMQAAFFDPGLEMPNEAEFNANPEAGKAKIVALKEKIDRVTSLSQMLKKDMEPPLSVPEGNESWRTYTDENLALFLATTFDKQKANSAAEKLHAVFAAYKKNDAAGFNAAVAGYRDYLIAHPPKEYDPARRDLETYLNAADPFWWSAWLYLVAFVVAILAWLGFPQAFNRTSLAMIITIFAVHTGALIVRMYVSERPPVTNLYSSAVFIGWGAVVLGIILELVYKIGIGNVVASLAGFGSLIIAYLLTLQGDTIEALEAVLDTQFWLTTHVVCITLGYATTYVAGLLGAAYVILGVATPKLTASTGKDLARMIYGILCFALFFSFVGTVLGGLWADDSWGRFWGWDPKENGALIIVLWNALVLHARWDGMVKDRGLAVLAVAGNITTSWSWFGVNQLGVGLHSYGFSQELLTVLSTIVLGSLAIVVAGSLPKSWWWSDKKLREAA